VTLFLLRLIRGPLLGVLAVVLSQVDTLPFAVGRISPVSGGPFFAADEALSASAREREGVAAQTPLHLRVASGEGNAVLQAVLTGRNDPQVVGVATRPCPADVVNVHPFGDRADVHQIAVPVGRRAARSVPDRAVTVFVEVPTPKPTAGGVINTVHLVEPIFLGYSHSLNVALKVAVVNGAGVQTMATMRSL
jgi:hypothetical protein